MAQPHRVGDLKLLELITMSRMSRYATTMSAIGDRITRVQPGR
jgi:hypothetical protein